LIPIAKVIFSEDEIEEVVKVLRSGNVRQGKKVEEFERLFAEKVGAEYAVAVSSGTAALHVAYLSVLKPGDEVIVPAFTFIATASTVVFAGGKPVFADIDETLTIDVNDVLEKITPRTKAIAPVHLFGNAADMKALMEIAEDHGLYLINDCAQAHGTKIDGKDVGSFDHLNCYSFYPTKNMSTGEGGMITTNDRELYERCKLIRSHGQAEKYNHVMLGLNYRMMEIQAVIGIKQLEKLDGRIKKRRKNAEYYNREFSKLDGIELPKVRKEVYHTYNQYSILLESSKMRDKLIDEFKKEKIGYAIHYPKPLTEQPALREFVRGECPRAKDVSQRIISLPVHPYLSENDLRRVIEVVERIVS